MPNLPVYKLKPQSGKGKLKTLHRDNLLPIGDLVRIPAIDNTEDVPTRPATRANGHKRHKRATTDHPIQLEGEMSTEASDLECDWPHRPYRTYLEKIIQRQEENNTDRAEQPGVRIPEKDSCPETENSPLEDQDLDTAPETDSGPQSTHGCGRCFITTLWYSPSVLVLGLPCSGHIL
ncbi:Vicilin-like antimicrobial peptides 2-2 [Dissostichus eleginoides]|uniref:Vicilin-like antimicrobial peptides 2-2 n=1 Tax=Dissostichus eleginoides TaxID=100907 RepID=A0AAD9ESY9_DISEL|nr:Vicilin-like antimicrobial peptides 2-2 [Dissostichus eleginoides]